MSVEHGERRPISVPRRQDCELCGRQFQREGWPRGVERRQTLSTRIEDAEISRHPARKEQLWVPVCLALMLSRRTFTG